MDAAILGAGDLAATLARRLAERELVRRVVMVDPADGRAKGKALDLMQSGPVEGYDVAVEGAADLSGAGHFDLLLVADPPAFDDPVARASDLATAIAAGAGGVPVVVAGLQAAPLLEALSARGLARERLIGSAPVAVSSALRRHIASELECEPSGVSVTLMGRPGQWLLPLGVATAGGTPVERLAPMAVRRALAAVNTRTPGPVALAAGAVAVVRALVSSRASLLPVMALLQGEYGHRGVAVAVPARVGAGRIQAVVEAPLEPVDRVAFDNAAAARATFR
jgi:malate dehydrogenase